MPKGTQVTKMAHGGNFLVTSAPLYPSFACPRHEVFHEDISVSGTGEEKRLGMMGKEGKRRPMAALAGGAISE
jgi:hypothetical protein